MVDASGAPAALEALIFGRLTEADLTGSVTDIVVAALLGDEDLDAVLGPQGWERPAMHQTAPTGTVPMFFLRSIVAEGFRGVGTEATLRLEPGPGLTLVVGRNGSGKSSFAEAAELAVTGESRRWSRNTAARTGWRNIHTSTTSRVAVGLAADGQAGTMTLAREWAPGSPLEDAIAYFQEPGARRVPGVPTGWAEPLDLYRPFLSYSELGTLVDGKPSEMYDTLQAILGLDQLIDAEHRLTGARKRLDEMSKSARQALPDLLSRLATHPDERASQAQTALSGRKWDLDAIDALAVGEQQTETGIAGTLRQIVALELPKAETVSAAVDRLANAEEELTGQVGTPAGDAQRTSGLLTAALNHYAEHPGSLCPVCAGRSLDEAWEADARREISRLAEIAQEANAAVSERNEAARALRTVLPSEPLALSQNLGRQVDATAMHTAWQRWAKLAIEASPKQLVSQAVGAFGELVSAMTELHDAAARELAVRSEAWQPMATALAAWTEQARASQHAADNLAKVKQALAWLKADGQEIRNARLEPFTQLSARIWSMLRQESNVELGPIRLEGSATRRRLSLDATVDGVPCAALGVMSQGELHALGLALFLPRATSPDSPFRFLLIDDPVQSMDPAKVDGLARVLSQIAQSRQVIVFTHDDRLAEAVRRLQIPATMWEVSRQENSAVELRKNDDPVLCYIDDARALARTRDLPEEARAVVVAGFCRSALEAACHEKIRRRRISAGARHSDIEQVLVRTLTLRQTVALALFDDASRGDQVADRLRTRYGSAAITAFNAAKAGLHSAYKGNLAAFVEDTAHLAEQLRS
jgi:recombinational DNA repair ATPase RecF